MMTLRRARIAVTSFEFEGFNFEPGVEPNLLAVARDVVNLVALRFEGHPPPMGRMPVVFFPRDPEKGEPPLVDVWARPGTYAIGTTVGGAHYAQFAYQLAHELGHVMLDPRRTSGIVEVVATAVSLQILDDLAEWWSVHPPFEWLASYAERFLAYRIGRESENCAGFPASIQMALKQRAWDVVKSYLSERRADLDANQHDQHLLHLGALAIRSKDVPWWRFVGLAGRTDPPPSIDPSFRSDLPTDLGVRDVLARVGR